MDLPLAKTDFGPAAKELVKQVLGFWEPGKIRRLGGAEAAVMVAKAEAEMTIENMRRTRALNRLVQDEEVLEEVVRKAIPLLNDAAKPDEISPDWFKNFTDKARLAGDEDIKEMWSRVLSGEVNFPGSFSKRVVNFLAEMEQEEAELFEKVCAFRVSIMQSEPNLLIYNSRSEIFTKNGVSFGVLERLVTLGLLTTSGASTYSISSLPRSFVMEYMGEAFSVSWNNSSRVFPLGKYQFTNLGKQLIRLCDPRRIEGYSEYLSQVFQGHFITLTKLDKPPVKLGPVARGNTISAE